LSTALVLTLLAAALPGPGPASPESRRPLALDDLDRLATVADPQVSPDGQWVAYTVTRAGEEDESGGRGRGADEVA